MDLGRKIKLIVTANYNQFLSWCHENKINPRDNFVRYVHCSDQLRGLKKDYCEVIFYGEYWKSKLIGDYYLERLVN